jgi:hypothetical protein
VVVGERLRRRLELRRSSAAVPHRNRFREAKVDPPWWDDIHDFVGEELEDLGEDA